MEAVIGAVLRSWAHQRGYAQRLVADLSDEDMVSQPVAGVTMNHPAWVLSHLTLYAGIVGAMLRGEEFEDPLKHRHGRESRPVNDVNEYPRKEALLAEYFRVHDDAARVLGEVGTGALEREMTLPRWRERWPRVGDAVIHLMLHHEAVHLGQISAWRRAGGRPAV